MDNGTDEKRKVNRMKAFFESIPVCRDGYREKELEKNAVTSAAVWGVLTVVCMSVMLVMASQKTIVIAEAAVDVTAISSSHMVNNADLVGNKYSLAMQETDGQLSEWNLYNTLIIPMAKGLGAGDVSIENHAITREIWIYLWGEDASFPAENPLTGDIGKIEYGIYEVQESGIVMKLYMDSVYELKSTMDNGQLTISLSKPSEKYDMIVVVDADPDDSVAMAVSRLLLKSNVGEKVKIYSTGYGLEEASDAQIHQLISEVGADIYVGLGTATSDNEAAYGIGCQYNDHYFIPDFGSLELADCLTRSTVISTVNRAIAPRGFEQGIGMELNIPAVKVELGHLSNSQEKELMNSPEYQNKLSAGIVNGLQEVYSMIIEGEPR